MRNNITNAKTGDGEVDFPPARKADHEWEALPVVPDAKKKNPDRAGVYLRSSVDL